jgi:predicted phage terminase large subunit-like protein
MWAQVQRVNGLGDLTPATLAGYTDDELAELIEDLPATAVDLLLSETNVSVDATLLQIAERVLPAYQPTDHTDFLASIITAAIVDAENGKDTRVVVEMPPGEGKSSICSVAAPLFALSRNPEWEVALVSAEASLATKWSRDCQHAVSQGHVPHVAISTQSKAVTEWETTEGGSFLARGVGGAITGRRIKVLVIDDPIKNLADAHSRVMRETLWDTWQSVLKTRMRPGSVVILVQTRWHEDDLAGRLVRTGDWVEVRFPALADESDVLGREPGEPLLSPMVDETPAQALERWNQVRNEVGSYVWDALYQQRPAPPGGAVFKTDWWQHNPIPHSFDRLVTSWDLTFGSQVGDFCVGQVWGQLGADCWLLDQVRGRWTFNDQIAQMELLAEKWPEANAHLVEKAATATAAHETLTRKIPGILLRPPRGSKEIRAQGVAPMVEAGNVHLPTEAPWLDDFHSEVAGFPSSAPHDDIVDAMSQALDYLSLPHKGMVTANPAIQRLPSNATAGMRGRSL